MLTFEKAIGMTLENGLQLPIIDWDEQNAVTATYLLEYSNQVPLICTLPNALSVLTIPDEADVRTELILVARDVGTFAVFSRRKSGNPVESSSWEQACTVYEVDLLETTGTNFVNLSL